MRPASVVALKLVRLCWCALACLPACGALALAADPAQPRRPNIVYILADDLGYGDVRCLNPQSKVPTPNLDRLAAQGLTFTDAHSASAVCTPTRYGILTGRYCWRTRLKSGVLGGFSPPLIEEGRLTVPALLRANGYDTAAVGKWHLGLDWPAASGTNFGDQIEPTGEIKRIDYTQPIRHGPMSVGFDSYFGIAASLDMPPYIFIQNDRTLGIPTATKKWIREGPAHPDFEAVDVLPRLTEAAVNYLYERARDPAKKPFFLYLALTSPHTPVVPRSDFKGRSQAGDYGDFVAETDWALGEVQTALRQANLEQDTLLIFTSDNGYSPGGLSHADAQKYGHQGSHIFRGTKADIWEGGHRIPFFARWPGRTRPGSTNSETLCLNSLLATCADLLSVKLPDHAGEDSFSIAPLLRGEKPNRPTHEAVVHHSIRGMFALRQGPWKFIDGTGSGGWTKGGMEADAPPGQLYHLAEDPSETRNLYREHPEIVKRLRDLLQKFKTSGRSAPRR